MKITNLKNVAIEISDFNLETATASDFERIRQINLANPVVVIKNNSPDLLQFAKLCHCIGNIANEPFDPYKLEAGQDIPVQRVTGQKKDGKHLGIFGQGQLDWHCNMNGPNRARTVGLMAVENVQGSVTSWLSTLKAYNQMSANLKQRLEGLIGHFHYHPESWAPGMADFQRIGMREVADRDGPYHMPILQKSLAGDWGLYFHFLNDCHFPTDPEVLDILKDFLFKEDFIYDHQWEVGDIVLSDQLVTLHKRQSQYKTDRLLYRYTLHPKTN